MTKTITLTINDLIEELDRLVDDRIKPILLEANIFSRNLEKNKMNYFETENFIRNKLSSLKKEIYLKLNDISAYHPNDKEDYEKIAKIIANTHDIVDCALYRKASITGLQESLEKLPNYIKKYFIPFEKFGDLKDIKTEGPYKFDGIGSFLDHSCGKMSKTFVQATKTKDILSQTELIFKTREEEEAKKIYVISESYPKKDIDIYFKQNDSILTDKLETLRFLALSSKIYRNEVINKNKSLEYFFSIILFSSKGFDNQFNKDMYEIYYKEQFDILKLLELKIKKNQTKNNAIEQYLENFFSYFNENLKMDSFNKDCEITGPMEEILNNLYVLVTNHLEGNKERYLLKKKIEKIEINLIDIKKLPSEITKKRIIFKTKKLLFQKFINKKINKFALKLQENKINNYNFDYETFSKELENVYIKECKLLNIKKYDLLYLKLNDEDILNIVYYNNGSNFINLSYEYKKRKDSNDYKYIEIKKFKIFIAKRIINIFNNLNLSHVKILNKIFANMHFSSEWLQISLLNSCWEIANKSAHNDDINNFKIFLLSRVFYPNTLTNKFYPEMTEHILKYSIKNILYSDVKLQNFLELYSKHREYLDVVSFLNIFNFSGYDLYKIFRILKEKNENTKLKTYIEYKLQELLLDERAWLMYQKIPIHNSYQQYQLVKKYPTDEVFSDKRYESIYYEMLDLNILVLNIVKDNILVAILVANINEQPIKYNITYLESNYNNNQVYEIFNAISRNKN